MKFWYVSHQWDGGHYAEADAGYIEANSLEEAVSRVEGWDELGYEPVDGAIDLRVDIYDEEGIIAEQVYLRREVGLEQIQKMLKEAEEYWANESDFSTEYLIHMEDDPEEGWYYVLLNGGAKGAFDRTCGDGEWRERYEPPKEIRYTEATRIAKEWGLEDFPFPPEEE